jgi:hypothetical protein
LNIKEFLNGSKIRIAFPSLTRGHVMTAINFAPKREGITKNSTSLTITNYSEFK